MVPGRRVLGALLALALSTACTGSSSAPAPATSTGIVPTPGTLSSEPSASPSSAYRALALPPGPALACSQATAMRDPATLIAAFRAARLSGSGAEGCLTRKALAAYSDRTCDRTGLLSSPGPTVLYRCGRYPVSAIPPGRIEASTSDRRHVQWDVTVRVAGGGARPTLYEHLTVGPGTPATGRTPARQVIVEVSAI